MSRVRKGLSWRLRGLVMARCYLNGRFICNWCCARLRADEVEIDHVTPVAKGGDDTPENLTVSCSQCNSWKSDKDPCIAETAINDRLECEATR